VSRSLTIACIQAQSRNNQPEANLAGAEPLVEQAAARGAQLLLCPELLAAGYTYHASIWQAGEPRDGLTESWLRRVARAHGVFVGASYLEAEGADFFNTFALAAPEGEVVGRVRKASLPAFEGWYFCRDLGPKSIDCELGRVAVGICNDNATGRFWNTLCEERPELLLMPHSAPVVEGRLLGSIASQAVRDSIASVGPHFARGFGIPVALVNKAASSVAPSPVPLLPGVRLRFVFPGGSMICDAEGAVLERLDERPGVAVASVELDPQRRRRPASTRSYWSKPPGSFPRLAAALWWTLEGIGRGAYALSRARRREALRRRTGSG
jgi:N-carbamoylputrescine amidase